MFFRLEAIDSSFRTAASKTLCRNTVLWHNAPNVYSLFRHNLLLALLLPMLSDRVDDDVDVPLFCQLLPNNEWHRIPSLTFDSLEYIRSPAGWTIFGKEQHYWTREVDGRYEPALAGLSVRTAGKQQLPSVA